MSRFMTYSIEFQMLSKDKTKIKTQMSKISVMRVFSLETW